MNVRKMFAGLLLASISLAALAGCSGDAEASAAEEEIGQVKSVTAINEVFGDGIKLSAVAVEYEKPIRNLSLSSAAYTVEGKDVTNIYANTAAETIASGLGVDGNYVIIELSAAYISEDYQQGGQIQGDPNRTSPSGETGPPSGESSPPSGETGPPAGERDGPSGMTPPSGEGGPPPGAGGSGMSGGGPVLGQADEADAGSADVTAVEVFVTQTEKIMAADGKIYIPSSFVMTNDKTVTPAVDDFTQQIYTDANYGNETLAYNLYVPKNYDNSKSYPLVLFMHDASVTGAIDPRAALTQGNGAVIWATPESQAENECFVVAPLYPHVIADDSSQTTEYMDITIDLINDLADEYSIDMNKIYNTGQSMGCMTSIAMDIKYPDMFAASLLVAGQWEPALTAPMADDHLWIVVCEGDSKAYPGMDAITETLKNGGATVSKATWDINSGAEEFAALVKTMTAEGSSINYTVLTGGSHRSTWTVAYGIEGIREWLFNQTK
jgi:predicted peptidase